MWLILCDMPSHERPWPADFSRTGDTGLRCCAGRGRARERGSGVAGGGDDAVRVGGGGRLRGAVLARVRDDAADATVGLGRRLLQRVFGSRREGEPPPEPLGALIADPEDDDALAAVRLVIRRALTDDASLQEW